MSRKFGVSGEESRQRHTELLFKISTNIAVYLSGIYVLYTKTLYDISLKIDKHPSIHKQLGTSLQKKGKKGQRISHRGGKPGVIRTT